MCRTILVVRNYWSGRINIPCSGVIELYLRFYWDFLDIICGIGGEESAVFKLRIVLADTEAGGCNSAAGIVRPFEKRLLQLYNKPMEIIFFSANIVRLTLNARVQQASVCKNVENIA